MLRLLKRRRRSRARAGAEAKAAPEPQGCSLDPRPTSIEVIEYSAGHVKRVEGDSVDDLATPPAEGTVRWVDVQGLGDTDLIHRLCDRLGLHPLVVEDILDTSERTKLDVYSGYLLVVVDTFYYSEDAGEMCSDQVSVILLPRMVVTFQEGRRDSFGQVRERLDTGRGRIRGLGPDFLAYALLDALVDRHFLALEDLGERIEAIEEDLVANPGVTSLQTIHQLRGDTAMLRKSVWPLREIVNGLVRGESPLIEQGTTVYLRDVYDHTIEIVDTTETFRDVLSTMLDIYLSSVSNRLNEIMKFLTVVSTIFIPLSFLAGLYGMNFHNMPELSWRWGYPVVLAVMAATAVGMLWYFRRRKWL